MPLVRESLRERVWGTFCEQDEYHCWDFTPLRPDPLARQYLCCTPDRCNALQSECPWVCIGIAAPHLGQRMVLSERRPCNSSASNVYDRGQDVKIGRSRASSSIFICKTVASKFIGLGVDGRNQPSEHASS